MVRSAWLLAALAGLLSSSAALAQGFVFETRQQNPANYRPPGLKILSQRTVPYGEEVVGIYAIRDAEDIPDGLAAFPALMKSSDGMMVLYQMAAFFVMAEICNRDASEVTGVTPEFVGDYRNGALDFGWDKFSDEEKLKKRTIELNNGRAAMMVSSLAT